MDRREFLKSMLGAAAVAAMPTAVLAAAEQASAPLADSMAAWTPSEYYFSCWVKKTNANIRTAIVSQSGDPLFTTGPMWERIGFKLSKELGDALSGHDMHCQAGYDVLQRVLKIVNQDAAEVCYTQLEWNPNAPQFSTLVFPHLPTNQDPYGGNNAVHIGANWIG